MGSERKQRASAEKEKREEWKKGKEKESKWRKERSRKGRDKRNMNKTRGKMLYKEREGRKKEVKSNTLTLKVKKEQGRWRRDAEEGGERKFEKLRNVKRNAD